MQRVGGAGEDPPDAVEIVAGAEVVRGGQHDPRHPLADAGVAAELAAGAIPGAHQYRPRTAASTHASMEAMTGAYPYPWMMLTSLAELVRSRRQPLIRPISRARIW